MIKQIIIERQLEHHPRAQQILEHFQDLPVYWIERWDHLFGTVKKPYLQKRDNLSLILGHKRGHLIKEAPQAYGLPRADEPHFYFIHAYNCIYECQYCYLQGHFDSPDLVLFLNHEEIAQAIEQQLDLTPKAWFHAGEFSDSLALSHLTGELPYYWDLFLRRPQSKLELRTKSVNIKEVLKLPAAPNIFISFSLSPSYSAQQLDLKTPSTSARLKAMSKLRDAGHALAIHLDPIVYYPNCVEHYEQFFNELFSALDPKDIHYLSLGVVRFPNNIWREVQKNYPESLLQTTPIGPQGRYPGVLRRWLLGQLQEKLLARGMESSKIYWCMETDQAILESVSN